MFSYQKLEVYQKSFLLNKVIYKLIKTNSQLPTYLKNQLGRASLSVVLNIAEGSAKFSNKDRRNFYVTARGSVFECASIIEFIFSEGDISLTVKEELMSGYEEISKMLFRIIKNLER